MKKILYILTKQSPPIELLRDYIPFESPDTYPTLVFANDCALTRGAVPSVPCYVLRDNTPFSKENCPFPTLDYRGMLHLIFENDSVIAL